MLSIPNDTQSQVNSTADRSTTPPADMSEESAVLEYLSCNEIIPETLPWAEEQGLNHQAVVGAIKLLLVEAHMFADNRLSFFRIPR